MSNGAGMAHKLAIEAGTAFRLRAFAAVVTSLVEGNLPRARAPLVEALVLHVLWVDLQRYSKRGGGVCKKCGGIAEPYPIGSP